LAFVRCTSENCSTYDDPLILDNYQLTGYGSSIIIGQDGFPAIAYQDGSSNQDLKFVHCTSIDCSTSDSPLTLVSNGQVQSSLSMKKGSDGFPVIAYSNYISPTQGLRLIHCTSVDCSTADTPLDLHVVNVSVDRLSLEIGSDGFPITIYSEGISRELKLIHCTNVECSTKDGPSNVTGPGSSSDNPVGFNSIAIGPDGFPSILFTQTQERTLTMIHCTNASCSSTDTPDIIHFNAYVSGPSSLSFGFDGLPNVTFIQNNNLRFNHCLNSDCSRIDRILTLDEDIFPGVSVSSLVTGDDGNPIVGYIRLDVLKVVQPI